jgi:glycosyltransferase involved in cell wall biosynthesis
MAKRKIAVLADWYLPGTRAGGPVRSLHAMMELLRDHYSFYVITRHNDLGSDQPYSDVVPDKLVVAEGIHYYYFKKESLSRQSIRNLLLSIQPDLIYLNSFWSFYFSVGILAGTKDEFKAIPVLLAPRGMLGSGARSIKSLKKNLFLFVIRFTGWYRQLSFQATNRVESDDIRRSFPRNRIFLTANIPGARPVPNKAEKSADRISLFFLSRISPVKNLHFALECLRQLPDNIQADYFIYGNAEDAAYVRQCETIMRQFPATIRAEFKGEIPFNEVQEKISRHHCLFMPTLNENYGHSIVESLFSGCPAIISDQTPWTDLEEYGAGYSHSLSSHEPFIRAIAHFARMDQQPFDIASKAAIDYISQKTDISKIQGDYIRMFDECFKN